MFSDMQLHTICFSFKDICQKRKSGQPVAAMLFSTDTQVLTFLCRIILSRHGCRRSAPRQMIRNATLQSPDEVKRKA